MGAEPLDLHRVPTGDAQQPPQKIPQMVVPDAVKAAARLQVSGGDVVGPAVALQQERRVAGQAVELFEEGQAVHILQLAAQYQHIKAPLLPQRLQDRLPALEAGASDDGALLFQIKLPDAEFPVVVAHQSDAQVLRIPLTGHLRHLRSALLPAPGASLRSHRPRSLAARHFHTDIAAAGSLPPDAAEQTR